MPEEVQRQRRQAEEERIEQGEEREAWNGLHEARRGQHRPAPRWAAARRQNQGHADEDAERERAGTQKDVLSEIFGQQVQRGAEAAIHAHLAAR